jgi:hypothetical protein
LRPPGAYIRDTVAAMEGNWMLGAAALLVVGAAAAGNSLSVAIGVWAMGIAWIVVGVLLGARRHMS